MSHQQWEKIFLYLIWPCKEIQRKINRSHEWRCLNASKLSEVCIYIQQLVSSFKTTKHNTGFFFYYLVYYPYSLSLLQYLFTVNEHFFKWTASMLYYSTTRDTVRVIIIWFPAEFASWLTYKEINSVYLKKKSLWIELHFPIYWMCAHVGHMGTRPTNRSILLISVYYVNNTHLSTESFLPI